MAMTCDFNAHVMTSNWFQHQERYELNNLLDCFGKLLCTYDDTTAHRGFSFARFLKSYRYIK